MRRYRYDDMLSRHFHKTSGVLGAAANVAKFGLGATTGIPIGAAGTAGAVGSQAVQIANSVTRPGGKMAVASLREKGASGAAVGGKPDWHHVLMHSAPYALFPASYAADALGHHNLASALSLGGLGTLAYNTGTATTPDKFDQAGLGAMGVAELLRMKNRYSGG